MQAIEKAGYTDGNTDLCVPPVRLMGFWQRGFPDTEQHAILKWLWCDGEGDNLWQRGPSGLRHPDIAHEVALPVGNLLVIHVGWLGSAFGRTHIWFSGPCIFLLLIRARGPAPIQVAFLSGP